jgi:hypothetical protein
MRYEKKRGNPFCLFLIVLLLIIIAACSHKMDGADNDDDDPCANAIGNGNEIITGPAGPGGADYDQVFRSLEVDPVNPDILYMGTERNGIVKTDDGGVTWYRLRQGIRHNVTTYPEIWDITVSPSNLRFVIAAAADSPGPVDFPDSPAGIYISTDAGDTWKRSNCGLTNSYALCVRFNPFDSAVIVLGIGAGRATFSALLGQPFDGALMYSDDYGNNWSVAVAPSGADKNIYWVLRTYGSATGSFITFGLNIDEPSVNLGFLRSEDGGESWTAFAPSLRTKLITAFDISTDGRTLYAIERDAFYVLKSTDFGSSWDSLAIFANGPVRISPSNPEVVIFSEWDKVYHSANGLQSHDLVLTTLDRVDDIEFAPSNPSVVYLATRGYHIYKSTDSGLTWSYLINLRSTGILN